MRVILLLFLLIAGAAVLDAAASPSAAPDGKWQPITNITDPRVQDLGQWAVAVHTRLYNDGISFSKVVSGEVQIVSAGANFRLNLDVHTVRIDGQDAVYTAVVFEQDWPTGFTRQLVDFAPAY